MKNVNYDDLVTLSELKYQLASRSLSSVAAEENQIRADIQRQHSALDGTRRILTEDLALNCRTNGGGQWLADAQLQVLRLKTDLQQVLHRKHQMIDALRLDFGRKEAAQSLAKAAKSRKRR